MDWLRLLDIKNLKLLIFGKSNQILNFQFDENNILLLRSINNPHKMEEIYSISDLFVIFLIEDNLPSTSSECIAMGTPVFGFKFGSIIDYEKGFLSNEIFPKGLSNVIKKGLHTNFIINNIREDCVNRYSINLQADRYISVYSKLISLQC